MLTTIFGLDSNIFRLSITHNPLYATISFIMIKVIG